MQRGDDRILLPTMPTTSRHRTAALAVVGVSLVLFLCAVPFATMPLAPVPAFVASYQSALAINDLITAILLAVTIIGIPFAWAHLKLAGIALWPIGKVIVPA